MHVDLKRSPTLGAGRADPPRSAFVETSLKDAIGSLGSRSTRRAVDPKYTNSRPITNESAIVSDSSVHELLDVNVMRSSH